MSEVLSAIFAEAGSKMPLVYHPRRLGDPSVLIADSSVARMHLGFQSYPFQPRDDHTHGMELAHQRRI